MTIHLKTPGFQELKPRIAVAGVGGAGGNAINNMIASGLQGVDFISANTDAQALLSSKAGVRIQLGASITEGLGAGARPEIGARAAEESIEEIRSHLRGLHMVFITAGMGGGTGTGAAPVIAAAARAEGVLTVGVVTKPFLFEGQRRMKSAEFGIELLAEQVDTLIVIPNQNLFRIAQVKTTFSEAFAMADQVLHDGIACMTDVMVKEGVINLDFADVNLIMRGGGKAMMGTGLASGENRGREAAEAAISNPLLDDVTLQGAGGLLVSIIGGREDLTLYEVDEAANRVREEVRPDANIIVGTAFDESLGGAVRVSVVATGLREGEASQPLINSPEGKKSVPASPVSSASPARISSPALAAKPAAAPEPPQTCPEQAAWGRAPGAGYNHGQPAPAAGGNVKMPAMEDFSRPAQALLGAGNQAGNGGDESVKGLQRRLSLFERLAGFAASSGKEEAAISPSVAIKPQTVRQMQPGHQNAISEYIDPHIKGGALSSASPRLGGELHSNGDGVDFPAFLRRSG